MSGQGLVKKLLFPAYADAGASDSFGSKVENTETEAVSVVSTGIQDMQSDATTAVQDNRSALLRELAMQSAPDLAPTGSDENGNEAALNGSQKTERQTKSTFFPSTAPPTHADASAGAPKQKNLVQRPFPTTSPRRSAGGPIIPMHQFRGEGGELRSLTVVDEDDTPLRDNRNDHEDSALRDGNDSDVMSDVLSTASEFGTVINLSSRMAEVDAMTMATPDPIYEEAEDSFREEDRLNLGLSLPMLLDEKPRHAVPQAEVAGVAGMKTDSPGDTSASAAAMVSAAFRRIGNGVGTLGRSGHFSAPTTPRGAPRVEDYLKSAYRSNNSSGGAPPSLLLRSPGSVAHQKLKTRLSESRPVISPRFTQTSRARMREQPGSLPEQPISQRSPLRFATGCFSFDNTLNEPGHSGGRDVSLVRPAIPESLSFDGGMQLEPKGSRLREILHTRSWETGKTPKKSSSSSAFRQVPSNARVLHENSRNYAFFDKNAPVNNMSPAINSNNSAVALSTPQRVEIEREDALDILACLVDRSVAFDTESTSLGLVSRSDGENASKKQDRRSPRTERVGTVEEDLISTFAEVGSRNELRIQPPTKDMNGAMKDAGKFDSSGFTAGLMDAINELRTVSSVQEQDHSKRMDALDQLMYSHVYASEMKRAANSASSWLRSIGRSGAVASTSYDKRSSDLGNQSAGEGEESEKEKFEEKIEKLTLEAMLHSVELKAKEKDEEARRLNTELTECRAEIGRLKSASQVEVPFKSPNCSMLDNDSDDSESHAVLNKFSESPIISPTDKADTALANAREELRLLKTAFTEANDTIVKLHAAQYPSDSDEHVAPVVSLPHSLAEAGLSKDSNSTETYSKHVVTPWQRDDSLPVPPDHELRSPIVGEILQQWTLDPAMHESLLSWLENVLAGADPQTVPPLTIANLPGQVKDGLIEHVLPLLEKRSDVVVDVKTRTQRKTTFDIAVDVSSQPQLPHFRERNGEDSVHSGGGEGFFIGSTGRLLSNEESEIGTASVSHSAVTAHVTNSIPRFSREAQEVNGQTHDELTEGSSGLIGAISSFGGLLSRKKLPSPLPHSSPSARAEHETGERLSPCQHREGRNREEPQPYQRVLSCPPGRIGLTFVQYRGHAMVSDVSPESPLSGWVFPSDVLIAIDECCVSGMRVRDIVKLLTARKDRQRALRVISSHAMNEITLNTSLEQAL